MKISYNWLKTLLPISLPPQKIGEILTEIGLEVESISEFISHKGLEKVVVGEVVEKQKHPNADKLSLTKVNVGQDNLLSIVCGAPNVDVHQKVLVALVGAKLYTYAGSVIEIKKSKIRGEISEGMICAEDELGISDNHDGIMVLPDDIPVGLSATEYFKVEKDYIFEIGLTANRGDAASHLGIVRDLKAYLKVHYPQEYKELFINFPASLHFPESSGTLDIDIIIQNTEDCKRYAGIIINGIQVAPSPQWLKNKLNAIGIRPINNIVDITNYVMMELGQPLHAFDYNAIKGNKIIVQNVKENTEFVTLDGITRRLTSSDLMICNAEEPMCIAGVFGGLNSGIKDSTQTVFIESAWFNPSAVRRTSARHNLKTDASFRFERFTDPDMVVYALNRACALILEIAGGSLSMGVKDIYPQPIEPYKVGYSIRQANDLFGQEIPFETTKKIIEELNIKIESESHEGMLLLVPPYKSDVTREIDIAEEVLRIYGYNKINAQKKFSFQIPDEKSYDQTSWVNFIENISRHLASKGFYETQGISFHHHSFYENESDQVVKILNPVNTELNVLRNNLLFSALQTLVYNERHQQKNIIAFEVGKIYFKEKNNFFEEYRLSLFGAGHQAFKESYYSKNKTFFYIKEIAESLMAYTDTDFSVQDFQHPYYSQSICLKDRHQQIIGIIGIVHPSILNKFEINTHPVVFADICLEKLYQNYRNKSIVYTELSKYPVVERDLSLLLQRDIQYADVKKIIFNSASKYLNKVEMFDYYEGKNIPEDKKSYAVRLYLQDKNKTLTDKEIDGIMNKVIAELHQQLKAELR